MSFPLPHVLVMLNLLRRSALWFGEAPRRAFVHRLPACLPRVLLFSCPSRLAARLSTRRAGRLAMGVGAVFDCGGRADVMLMSC